MGWRVLNNGWSWSGIGKSAVMGKRRVSASKGRREMLQWKSEYDLSSFFGCLQNLTVFVFVLSSGRSFNSNGRKPMCELGSQINPTLWFTCALTPLLLLFFVLFSSQDTVIQERVDGFLKIKTIRQFFK